MTNEGVVLSVTEKDGQFFYSLNETDHVGPFETEEAAVEAVTTFVAETFAAVAKQALFGSSK